MGCAIRKMAVIMILMNEQHGWRSVNDVPFLFARFVDHPIIPAGAADGEIRHIPITGLREEEKIAPGGTMKPALRFDRFPQPRFPPLRKIQRRGDITIPALT